MPVIRDYVQINDKIQSDVDIICIHLLAEAAEIRFIYFLS